jgi:branched-chain amino acid transport system ATP-binding protein
MAILEVRDLHRSFGAVRIAQGIDLAIEQGSAIGIIGPNGAGKTSFFNLVGGDLQPDKGAIWLEGTDITAWGARKRARAGIARTYQVPQAFGGMTVYENILVGALFGGGLSSGHAPQFCREILDRTGLSRFADTPAGSLTLLNRKRLELARALSTQPKILLLDEIAGGLTDAECTELVLMITEINQQGVTVIWIEHVVHALLKVVGRLLVLTGGRFIREGEPHAVMNSAEVKEIYLGVEPGGEEAGS